MRWQGVNLSQTLPFVLAVMLGVVHYLAGIMLVFHGSVINPTRVQEIYSNVGFILLLPFSAAIFIPVLDQRGFDVVAGFMSLVFWIFMYHLLLRKLCYRRVQ